MISNSTGEGGGADPRRLRRHVRIARWSAAASVLLFVPLSFVVIDLHDFGYSLHYGLLLSELLPLVCLAFVLYHGIRANRLGGRVRGLIVFMALYALFSAYETVSGLLFPLPQPFLKQAQDPARVR